MASTLSVKELLSFGWRTFKTRPWIFVKAGLALLLISLAFNIASDLVTTPLMGDPGILSVIVFGILWLCVVVASIYVSLTVNNMGFLSFYLKAHESTETLSLRDLYRPQPILRYFLASLLFGFIVFVGTLLLIIPGIIASIALFPMLYLVLDKDMQPIPALKEAARLTKGSRWKLLQLGLALTALNIVGFLALLVGLFITVPVTMLACVHAYRTLAHGVAEVVPAAAS